MSIKDAKDRREAAYRRADIAYERAVSEIENAIKRAQTNKLTPNEERNRAIWAGRKSGETYAALGRKFNLSGDRITQICNRESRHEKWEGDSPDRIYRLGSRAKNVLRNLNLPNDPSVVAAFDWSNVKNIPNCGVRTLTEIASWAKARGYPINITKPPQ